MLGGYSAAAALRKAQQTFRGLQLDELKQADLQHARTEAAERPAGDSLAAHSHACMLGSVAGFFSHSWNDPAPGRFAALRSWALGYEEAHGERPVIWLDKASVHACIYYADTTTQTYAYTSAHLRTPPT